MPERAAPPEFEILFHAHYGRISRVIARVVNDPARAEELAVDVFWKLWRNPLAQTESAGGWLYRTAVRAGLDELRRQSRRLKNEAWFDAPVAGETPEQTHVAKQERQRVRRVLAAMPERQAELLLLRSDGFSYEELASALKLNPSSIGKFLTRAQEEFRKEYVKHYGRP